MLYNVASVYPSKLPENVRMSATKQVLILKHGKTTYMKLLAAPLTGLDSNFHFAITAE